MELVDLETFVTAVREESLSAAARELFVSQPAVSVRIRRLERELGSPLFERSGRGVVPTPTGRRLYERTVPLLRQLRDLSQELDPEGPVRGRLDLGATDLVAIYHLPRVLRGLRRAHPDIELAMHVEGTVSLTRLLERGDVELAIGTLPVPAREMEETALFTDALVVVAGPDHPLAAKRRVAPRRLVDETWILHKPDSVTRQLVEEFFATHGAPLRIAMEISSPEAIKELVHARLGISALPECAVRREIAGGRLVKIPVGGFRLERTSGLLQLRGRALSRPGRALRELLVASVAS